MARTKTFLGLAAAFAVVGAAVVVVELTSKETFVPVPNNAAETITKEQLEAARVPVFFGHQSVGRNILDGVTTVYSAKGVSAPELTELELGAQPAGNGIRHLASGKNGDPQSKLDAFDQALRSGLAGESGVALMKFCYVDIKWDTDVDALFEKYQQVLSALERDFPNVTFLHATTPLTTGPSGIKDRIKVLIGRDDNAARTRYNELVRAAYGPDLLLDVAAIESTDPAGATANRLFPGYSSDGAHLNSTGGSLVAVGLLSLLANHAEPGPQ